MFPNQTTNMLSFQSTDNNNENNAQDQIWGDEYGGPLHGTTGALNSSNNNSRKGSQGRGRGRGRKSAAASTSAINSSSAAAGDEQQRKMIHRQIERQRRQEMSDLCASLRSVLPAQYIKGKRSTSDQLGEAVNYIKDLEKNVKELGEKRDQLKKSIGSSTSCKRKGDVGGSSGNNSIKAVISPGTVVLIPRLGGLDIEINVWYGNEGFCLSNALHVILDEGLGIASYTSTKVEHTLVHNIVCEVSDMSCIDIDQLHQRLIFLVC